MLNAWMDTFVKQNFDEWTCYKDTDMGVLIWYKPKTDLEVRATPNWEDCKCTPIEYGDGSMVDEFDKYDFVDINEYYEAMKPYLEAYEDRTRN